MQQVIREATEDDIPRIVALGAQFLVESAYRDAIAFNPAQMDETVRRMITGGDDSVFLVAEASGVVVGMMGLIAHTHFFSGERTAGEVVWYVEPSSRGSLGKQLWARAEQWARDRGALVFQMIAPDERIGQMYAARGYTRVETTWQISL